MVILLYIGCSLLVGAGIVFVAKRSFYIDPKTNLQKFLFYLVIFISAFFIMSGFFPTLFNFK